MAALGALILEACYPESRTLVVVLSNLETSPVKEIAERLAAFAFEEEAGKADSGIKR